jgi:hypothetical protein
MKPILTSHIRVPLLDLLLFKRGGRFDERSSGWMSWNTRLVDYLGKKSLGLGSMRSFASRCYWWSGFCPAIDYFVFAIKLSAARVRVMMPVLMVGSASGAHFGECVPGSVLLSTVLA